jgi:hypothetical protein
MTKTNMVARPPRVQRTIAAILGVFDITKVPEVLVCTPPEGVGLGTDAIAFLTRK